MRLVGERDELRPVGGDAERRDAAEVAMGRGQLETAAKLERAEAGLIGRARVEGVDRASRDLDPGRRRGGRAPLRERRMREEKQREEDGRERGAGAPSPHISIL